MVEHFIDERLFMRTLGFLVVLPIGWSWITIGLRMTLSLLVAMSTGHDMDLSSTVLSLPFDFAIGGVVGLPFLLVTQGGAIFGELFDFCRGQSVAQIYDPVSSTSPSVSATLSQYGVLSLLLAGNLLLKGVLSVQSTIKSIPHASLVIETQNVGIVLLEILTITKEIFETFLPLGLLLVLIEVSYGFLGLVLPKVSLNSESFKVKSVVGFYICYMILDTGVSDDLIRTVDVIGGTLLEALR